MSYGTLAESELHKAIGPDIWVDNYYHKPHKYPYLHREDPQLFSLNELLEDVGTYEELFHAVGYNERFGDRHDYPNIVKMFRHEDGARGRLLGTFVLARGRIVDIDSVAPAEEQVDYLAIGRVRATSWLQSQLFTTVTIAQPDELASEASADTVPAIQLGHKFHWSSPDPIYARLHLDPTSAEPKIAERIVRHYEMDKPFTLQTHLSQRLLTKPQPPKSTGSVSE